MPKVKQSLKLELDIHPLEKVDTTGADGLLMLYSTAEAKSEMSPRSRPDSMMLEGTAIDDGHGHGHAW